MDHSKTRPWMKYAAVVAAIALLVVGAATAALVWMGGEDAESEEDLVGQARATLTARAPELQPTSTISPAATLPRTPTLTVAASTCAADSFAVNLPTALPLFDLEHADWYGSNEAGLWASPADFGLFMPEGFAEAPSLWFAGQPTTIMWFGTVFPVEVTGERLDGAGTIEPVEPRDIANDIQWTDIVIPEPGCWQLTGTSDDATLTMTVQVLPIEFRPDYQILVRLEESRPYDPPPTCAVSPVTGLEIRDEGHGPHYWFESDELTADFAGWYVAGEQQGTGVYGDDVADGLAMTARSLEAGSREEVVASTAILTNGRVARWIFPSPGCWELEFETPTTTTTFTVYVYPADCLPTPADGEFLVSCEPPSN